MLFVQQEKVSGRHFFAFDRQSERWALSEVLTVQERVSGTTQVTLPQCIIAMVVLQSELPHVFASNLKIICY